MHDDPLPDSESFDAGDAPVGIEKLIMTLPVDHSGTTVYLKGWRVPGTSRHAIILVHDLGEHTELYRETALDFVRAGYSCFCFDLRGHGRSGRRLGHATSYNVLVNDLLQITAWVRHLEGGRAPILLGQGIGALIVIDFTKDHGNLCHAAILSAPCLELSGKVGWVTRSFIKVLAETWPTFRIPTNLSPRFSRDLRHEQEVEAARRHHSLATFPQLSAVFTNELLSAIERTEAQFIAFQGDVLILCPNRDNICTYAKVRKAVALHDNNNLEVIDLKDVGHNVFSDTNSRKVAFDEIIPWLNRIEVKALSHIKTSGLRLASNTEDLLDFKSSEIFQSDKMSAAKF